MAMITIDGVELPGPSKYGIPDFDLDSDDTNRNELGVLQRDRIRQGVFKIELEWKGVTSAQLHTIKEAVKPDKFSVTFVTETGYIAKDMYASDRKTEMIKYNSDYTKIRWNLSFNLTEF